MIDLKAFAELRTLGLGNMAATAYLILRTLSDAGMDQPEAMVRTAELMDLSERSIRGAIKTIKELRLAETKRIKRNIVQLEFVPLDCEAPALLS